MTIQAVEKRISELLDEAIELAYMGKGYVSGMTIAERLFEAEPEAMEALKKPWMTERLAWQANRKRAQRWRARSSQMDLPGFEEMPRSIFLRNGQRPRLDYATAAQVADHIKLLRTRQRDSPKVKKMEAVLELMRRYTPEEPGITWAAVKQKELERRDFERIVGPS